MIAGRMRSIIHVWRPTLETGAYGETKPGWADAGEWRAERVSLSGKRTVESAELFADYSVRYNVRDTHRPEPGWQLDGDDGLRYEIHAVVPTPWRGMLTLVCERVNQ